MQIYSGDCFTKYSFLDSQPDGDESLDKITTKICAHYNWIRHVAMFNPKYNSIAEKYKDILVTISDDLYIKLWDIDQNICINKYKLSFEAYCLSIMDYFYNSQPNQAIIIGGEAGNLIVFDYINQINIKDLSGTKKNIINVATIPKNNNDCDFILNSNTKGEIRIWKWKSNLCIFKINIGIQPIHSIFIWNVNFSSKKDIPLIVHSYEESVIVWNFNLKKRIKTITQHTNWIKSIIVKTYKRNTQFAHIMFSAGSDNTIRITNIISGSALNVLQFHKSGILNLEFYENYLLSCECNGKLALTNLNDLSTKILATGLTLDYYKSFQTFKISDNKLKIFVIGALPRRAGYHYLHIFNCDKNNDIISFGYS